MASNPAEILAAGQALVPNAGEQMLHEQMGRLQLQGAQLQNQAQAQQLRMQQIALQRQQSFGGDMHTFLSNPTAEGLAGLYGRYPEFATQLKDSWGALDEQRRRSDTTQIGSAASLAAKGDYTGAANLIQSRIAADKAAGHDASTDQALYDHLTSSDPAQQKAALGMMTIALSAAVGPDHAADVLKANGMDRAPMPVGLDQRLVDPSSGQEIVGAHPKLELANPTFSDGTTRPVFGNPYTGQFGAAAAGGAPGASPAPAGGAPGSSAAATTGAPLVQAMLPITAASESRNRDFNPDGTPVVSPKGAKGRMQVMPGTNADPGFGVRPAADDSPDERARVGRDYLAAMMQRYGGDPAKAWAAYNAGPGRLDHALAQGGNWLARMPADTRKYVMANMSQLRGPQTAMAATGVASDAMPGAPPQAAAGGAPAASGGASDPYSAFSAAGGSASTAVNTKGAPPGFAWNADHTQVEPIKGSEQDPNSYDPKEIDDLARNWIPTGKWGGGGMGGGSIPPGLKKAAMARASQIMQAAGITAEQLPMFRARYGADAAALNNISGIESGLHASESALKPYMDQVAVRHKALVDAGILDNGSPTLNAARMATYSQVGSGDTKDKITRYRDALNALRVEYGKFMSSASGMSNTPTTDRAANVAESLNDEAAGPAALAGHLAQLRAEAKIKMQAVTDQRVALERKLSSYLGGASASSAPVQVRSVQQYKALPSGTHYLDPNGVHRVKP